MGKARKVQDSGGQALISLPTEARQQLGVQKGDMLDLTVENGAIVLRPLAVATHFGEGEA
jgi:AbrB family looped-hinge helix DNA binding protein